jgi:hypothetical protein
MRDYALGSTFDVKFTTRAFATGVPTTLAGTPVISAYPDNSITQLTAGITLTVDFDGVTGLHNIRVVATSGNGYAAGSNYALVITTGTVGGTSVVGEVVAEFSLEAQSPLRPATAGRTLVVDAAGLADANAVKMGPTGSGTAQTARDIGASVLLSAGVGAGQLDFTAGVVKANPTQWLGGTIPAVNVTGVPLVDLKYTLGTLSPAPAGRVAIASGIRKNTALANFEFLMTDSTNHNPVTGKTVTVTRSIDDGAFAAGTLSAVTEIGVGIYAVDFGAGDLNGTVITLRAVAAGCDDTFVTIVPDP